MSKKITFIIIMAVMAGVIAIAGFFFSTYIKNNISDNLVDQYGEQELLIAKDMIKILELEVSAIQEKLNIIAQIPAVRDGDTKTCNAKLKEVFANMNEKVGNLGRMNVHGVFTCSITESTIGVDGKQYPHLQQIIDERRPVLGRMIVSTADDGTPNIVTSLHVPMFDASGKFVGTLGGAIYFSDIARKYLEGVIFAKQGYLVLQDDNGDILYHPNADFMGKNIWGDEMQKATGYSEEINTMTRAVSSGKSGVQRYIFEGKEKVAAYAPAHIFPDRIWAITVTVPIEDVDTALTDTNVNKSFSILSIIMITLIILLTFTSTLYLIKTVFNPIISITNSIDKISKGDLKQTLDVPEGNDEIGKLAIAFNRVLASLKLAIRDKDNNPKS